MSGYIEAVSNVMFDIITLDETLSPIMNQVVFDGNKIDSTHIDKFEKTIAVTLRGQAVDGVIVKPYHYELDGQPRTYEYTLPAKDIKPRMIGACLRRWYREKKKS